MKILFYILGTIIMAVACFVLPDWKIVLGVALFIAGNNLIQEGKSL